MDARFEVIDAFVDGERVDAAALKHALSEPAGRDYLVDVWLLREGVQEEMAADTSAPPAMLRARAPRTWLFAAALIACVIGGYFIGYRVSEPIKSQVPPPPAVTTTTPPSPSPAPLAAPVPTRVITVQFGTDSPASGGGE